ncbi:MAG TPA: hypothetical protein VFQ60_00110 [Patescibacteria group bacterium]|nr:hypothetical protein [Patescibacteria group bacterium]
MERGFDLPPAPPSGSEYVPSPRGVPFRKKGVPPPPPPEALRSSKNVPAVQSVSSGFAESPRGLPPRKYGVPPPPPKEAYRSVKAVPEQGKSSPPPIPKGYVESPRGLPPRKYGVPPPPPKEAYRERPKPVDLEKQKLDQLQSIKLRAQELFHDEETNRERLEALETEMEEKFGDDDAFRETPVFERVRNILSDLRESYFYEEREREEKARSVEQERLVKAARAEEIARRSTPIETLSQEAAIDFLRDMPEEQWNALSEPELRTLLARCEQAEHIGSKAQDVLQRKEEDVMLKADAESEKVVVDQSMVAEAVAQELPSESQEQMEAEHPFGPEQDPPEVQEANQKIASGFLDRLRKSRWGKPILRFVALLAGAVALDAGSMNFKETAEASSITHVMPKEQEPEELEDEKRLENPGVRQSLMAQMLREVEIRRYQSEMSGGHRRHLTEYRARGLDTELSLEDRQALDQLPSLQDKFVFLHRDDEGILNAYFDSDLRIRSYRELAQLMGGEFRHSNAVREFTELTAQSALEVIPKMNNQQEAMDLFHKLSNDMYEIQGALAVRNLMLQLRDALPRGHILRNELEASALVQPEALKLFEKHKDNMALFDQVAGTVTIYRNVNGKMIRLEVMPANGGDPESAAYGAEGAHSYVRTPDGSFTFYQTVRHKTPNWQMSWVADGSKLRYTADKQNVEYQDLDGTWKRLTGEEAEFFGEKPFKKKEQSAVFRAATTKMEDGTVIRPNPWTVSDLMDEEGKLKSVYDRNDFGPMAIKMLDPKSGEVLHTLFHSSPMDRDPEKFLEFSHGCSHMKPGDVQRMAHYLKNGATIRISSVLGERPEALPESKRVGIQEIDRAIGQRTRLAENKKADQSRPQG